MNLVSLKESLADALHTRPYLRARQLKEKGTALIHTANLNLDFAHSDIWGHSNNKRVYYITQEGLEIHKKGKNIPMRALLGNLSLT